MQTHKRKEVKPSAKPSRGHRDSDFASIDGDHNLLSLEEASAISGPTVLGLSTNYVDATRRATGTDVGDTLVTLNSKKPDRVGGLSCAQGSHVDLGRGRVEDIDHEIAHVAQHKTGQTQVRMHFNGLPDNSDPELERDADIKGSRIRRLAAGPVFTRKPRVRPPDPHKQPVLRFDPKKDRDPEDSQFDYIKDFSFKDLIRYQEWFQRFVKVEPHYYEEQVTTVGFEHEFAQAKLVNEAGEVEFSSLLKDLPHLELAKSTSPKLAITDLPFTLETDSNSALELVSPPFLLQTEKGRPLPQQKLIDRFDDIMTKGLEDLADRSANLGDLVDSFPTELGIRFSPLEVPELKPFHVNHATDPDVIMDYRGKFLTDDDIRNIPVNPTTKRFRNSRIAQANIATDLETAFFMEEPLLTGFKDAAHHNVLQKHFSGNTLDMMDERLIDKNMVYFVSFLSRVLLTQMSVEPMKRLRVLKQRRFDSRDDPDTSENDWIKGRKAASFIKDFTGVWVKDSIINMGLGVLSFDQWKEVFRVVEHPSFERMLMKAIPSPNVGRSNTLWSNAQLIPWLPLLLSRFSLESLDEVNVFLGQFRRHLRNSLRTLRREIHRICAGNARDFDAKGYVQAPPDVDFHEHNPERHIRVRQDTLIDANSVNSETMNAIWPGRFLHVVEDRRSRGVAGIARRKIAWRESRYRYRAYQPDEIAANPKSARIASNSHIGPAADQFERKIEPYLAKSFYFDFNRVFDLSIVKKYVDDTNSAAAIFEHIQGSFRVSDIPESLKPGSALSVGMDMSRAILDLINEKKMLWGSGLHLALIRARKELIRIRTNDASYIRSRLLTPPALLS